MTRWILCAFILLCSGGAWARMSDFSVNIDAGPGQTKTIPVTSNPMRFQPSPNWTCITRYLKSDAYNYESLVLRCAHDQLTDEAIQMELMTSSRQKAFHYLDLLKRGEEKVRVTLNGYGN